MVAKFDPVDVDPRRRSGGSDATPNPTPDQTDPLKTYGDPIPVVFGSQWVNGICASAGTFNGSGRAQRRDKLGYSFTDNWLGIVGTAEEVTTVGQGQYLFCAGPVVAIDAFSVNDSDPFLVFTSANGGSMHYSYLCAINSGALSPPTLNYGDFTATVPSWRNSGTAAYRVPFGPWVTAKSDRFLGPDQKPPQLKALVRGYQATLGGAGTIYTTNAVTAIKAIVEHRLLGLGLPSGTIVSNVGADNASGSSLDTFLAAVGWGIRRTYSKVTALEAIDEILRGIDATCVWTGSVLKLLPLYEQAAGAYSPPASAQALGDDDFVVSGPNEDPIEATRTAEADTYNVYPIQFPSSAAYVESPTIVESMAAVKASMDGIGVRRSDTIDLPTVSSYDQALYLSGALAARASFNRTKFRFRLSWRYIFLEPGDLVSLTQPAMGLSGKIARIQAVEESDDGIFVEAIEWYPGTSVTPVYSAQTADGQNNNPLINRTPPVLGSNPINLLPGTIGGANLLANGSFDVGATTGGGTDGWVVYDNNGVATLALRTDGGMFGANYARVAWTSNPNTAQPKGLLGANNYTSDRLPWGGGVRYRWKGNTTYVISYYARATVAGTTRVEWNNWPASWTPLFDMTVPGTSTWNRYAFRITTGATVEPDGSLYLGATFSAASGTVDYDGVMVTEGLTLENFAISPYDGMQASAGAASSASAAAVDAQQGIADAAAARDAAFARNRTFAQASPPTSPAGGYNLQAGDLWANTDTTTNCPDNNCKGHTIDPATSQPYQGSARPHASAYHLHRWTGSAWVDSGAQDLVTAGRIQAGAINAANIFADDVITSPKIVAGAVTANKLTLVPGGGAALNADPGCSDLTAWDTSQANFSNLSVVQVDGPTGSKATAIRGWSVWLVDGKHRSVRPSTMYRVTAKVRRNSTAGGMYIRASQVDSTGSVVQNLVWNSQEEARAYSGSTWDNFSPLASTTDWQIVTGYVLTTPAAQAVRLYAVLADGNGSASNYHEIADFKIEEMVNASLVVDGAITGAKISGQSLETSDYQYSGTKDSASEVATRGARIRTASTANGGSELPAIVASPAGIKIGSKTIDQTWLAQGRIVACSLSSSSGTITMTGAVGIASTPTVVTQAGLDFIRISGLPQGLAALGIATGHKESGLDAGYVLTGRGATTITSNGFLNLRCFVAGKSVADVVDLATTSWTMDVIAILSSSSFS